MMATSAKTVHTLHTIHALQKISIEGLVIWAYRHHCAHAVSASRRPSQNWLDRRLVERKGVRREVIGTVKYLGIELVDLSLLAEPKPDRPAQAKEPETT